METISYAIRFWSKASLLYIISALLYKIIIYRLQLLSCMKTMKIMTVIG